VFDLFMNEFSGGCAGRLAFPQILFCPLHRRFFRHICCSLRVGLAAIRMLSGGPEMFVGLQEDSSKKTALNGADRGSKK
jgi:hypothetical protein